MLYKDIIILLDFDRTLFDTDNFINDLKKIFQTYGIDQDQFIESYKKTKPYNFSNHIDNTNIASEKKEELLQQLNSFTKKLNNYIFADAKDLLEFTYKNKIKTMLVTYGSKSFQNLKIKYSAISKYFNEIHINQKQRVKTREFEELSKKYKNKKIIIVDDMLENTLDVIKKYTHLFAIRIDRKLKRERESMSTNNFFEIDNLNKIKKIIPLI